MYVFSVSGICFPPHKETSTAPYQEQYATITQESVWANLKCLGSYAQGFTVPILYFSHNLCFIDAMSKNLRLGGCQAVHVSVRDTTLFVVYMLGAE